MTRAAGQLGLTALTALLLVLVANRVTWAERDTALEIEVGVEEAELHEAESVEAVNTVSTSTVLLGGNKTITRVETLSQRTLCSHGIKPFPGIRLNT